MLREDLDPTDKGHMLHDLVMRTGKGSTDKYLKWCEKNGFEPTTEKTLEQIAQERAASIRLTGEAWIKRDKKLRKHVLESALDAVAAGKKLSANPSRQKVPDLVAIYLSRKKSLADSQKIHETKSDRLVSVVAHLEKSRSPILGDKVLVKELIGFVERGGNWAGKISDWKPNSHNAEKQLHSLMEHLRGL